MPDRRTMPENERINEEQEIRSLMEKMLTFTEGESEQTQNASLVLREDSPDSSLSEEHILSMAPMLKKHCFCIPAGVLSSAASEEKTHE